MSDVKGRPRASDARPYASNARSYAPDACPRAPDAPHTLQTLARVPEHTACPLALDAYVVHNYKGNVANTEQGMSTMAITHSGRVYQGPDPADKGKDPATAFKDDPKAASIPTKKVTKDETEAFMNVIKASEHKVLTTAQVLNETALDRFEETMSSIFSNHISFAEDELPSEGYEYLRALHIVCKCNNHIVGRVMIDNGSTLNACLVSTLKPMNVDMSRICASKMTVQAFDGSRREVNGEIDLLIDVGPYSFSVTLQILEIPNAFSLLLGRPWIHATDIVPSSLHQKLKFFAEGKPITVNGEEDFAIYKETVVPESFILFMRRNFGIGGDLVFALPATRLYRHKVASLHLSRRFLWKALQGHPNPTTLAILLGTAAHFEALFALLVVYAITEETSSKVPIHLEQEDEELTNWTSVPCHSAVVVDV
ncbi:hypothetical protein CRG98_012093 [Punica granatum]|uniref:Uncharacterized protein n=1 Tax=Punica granatum TaxID=22663 RepID=A0A2I0KG81_PUNGR|nr:hypothetical protein CRG98_012093 [Punica granatum]